MINCSTVISALLSVVVAGCRTHLLGSAVLGSLAQTPPMQKRRIWSRKLDWQWSVRCDGIGAAVPSLQQPLICLSSLNSSYNVADRSVRCNWTVLHCNFVIGGWWNVSKIPIHAHGFSTSTYTPMECLNIDFVWDLRFTVSPVQVYRMADTESCWSDDLNNPQMMAVVGQLNVSWRGWRISKRSGRSSTIYSVNATALRHLIRNR